MRKRPSKWWLLLVWVAIVALINLVAPYIPYKLYEFLFLFWICITLVGAIPVFMSAMGELHDRQDRKAHDRRVASRAKLLNGIEKTGVKRKWCWKTNRMVESSYRD